MFAKQTVIRRCFDTTSNNKIIKAKYMHKCALAFEITKNVGKMTVPITIPMGCLYTGKEAIDSHSISIVLLQSQRSQGTMV